MYFSRHLLITFFKTKENHRFCFSCSDCLITWYVSLLLIVKISLTFTSKEKAYLVPTVSWMLCWFMHTSVGSTVKMCWHEPWRGKFCVTVDSMSLSTVKVHLLVIRKGWWNSQVVNPNSLIFASYWIIVWTGRDRSYHSILKSKVNMSVIVYLCSFSPAIEQFGWDSSHGGTCQFFALEFVTE